MKDKLTHLYGDRLLSAKLQRELDGTDHLGACVAFVSPDLPSGSLTAGVGVDPERTFHMGSIGKALNGLIYSSMVTEGTVSGEDTLDKFLPLSGVAAGLVTLESLVTHTSGLPTIGGGRRASFQSRWRLLRKKDPQPETLEEFVSHLRKAPVCPKGFHYSNLGGSALGHALAAADGVSYPDLIANRIAKPLGCPNLYVPGPGDLELSSDVPGLSIFNTSQESWTGEGYAPAGGVRASADDMVIILDAILNHPLPGWTSAFTPLNRTDFESSDGLSHSIGAGWFIQEATGSTGELAWHNGYANGFGSAIVLDLENYRGAFVSVLDGSMQVDTVSTVLSLMKKEDSHC
ncbi:serine hydrolase [Corynebacterium pseudotuberculosis 258]|uniref:Serine hydrolase n=1 Tax=Corynebacterium pseudotuberculosis 258 TaxID=1168865 RepID=A0AAU8RPK1_CORPS|nr:serine hydrolase domain-containing protein [Corynebacterium pseudotuberculosis]AJF93824.2 serine hydrolase [Corynebacterium pseudotuberculosis 258]ART29204.1 serine hydrolase [Corynebacterium pseudotuberculosis CIP 52.97]